jgi:hypothetical protein
MKATHLIEFYSIDRNYSRKFWFDRKSLVVNKKNYPQIALIFADYFGKLFWQVVLEDFPKMIYAK